MTQNTSGAARGAARMAHYPNHSHHFAQQADGLLAAAKLLLPHLQAGRKVDAPALREAMVQAFGASDAQGAWDWKSAYDACEAAAVLFLRKHGKALVRRAPPKHWLCSKGSQPFSRAIHAAWSGLRCCHRCGPQQRR